MLYRNDGMKLESVSLEEKGDRHWKMTFTRLRSTGIPKKSYSDTRASVDLVQLGDGEYVGEQTNVIYDRQTRILMLQKNMFGVNNEGIEMYMNEIWQREREMNIVL